LEILK